LRSCKKANEVSLGLCRKTMSSIPILTSDSLWFFASRSEFFSLKFPNWSKCLPIDEGYFFRSGHERSEGLLFRLGRTGVLKKTSLLPIPKRGAEV
jgi:hypothetical protein